MWGQPLESSSLSDRTKSELKTDKTDNGDRKEACGGTFGFHSGSPVAFAPTAFTFTKRDAAMALNPHIQPGGDHSDSHGPPSEVFVERVLGALQDGQTEETARLVSTLHAADFADVLEQLPSVSRAALAEALGGVLDAEVYTHLDEAVREEIVAYLDAEALAGVVSGLASDDAVDFIEDLDESERCEVLDAMPAESRILLEDSLRYPEDSAGRLMRRESVIIPSFWNVGRIIDYLRSETGAPRDFHLIVVVGPTSHPLGTVQLSRLLQARREVDVTEIMESELRKIPVSMDQEEVAFLFRHYGLVSAPVVDDTGRMLGVIDIDDVLHVMDEEAEDDLLKLGGVREDDFYEAVVDTTRSRFSWLLINLMTALAASVVIGFFDAAIEQVVALAVLMPVVASMGGNAGTQTLTVAVRALAVRELTPANMSRIIGKEVIVGGINGILFAMAAGIVAWVWFGSLEIGGVIGAAMILNLVVAGFAGVMIPLILDRMDIDPAVASTVILTTVTDIVGFLVFLGLGAMILI